MIALMTLQILIIPFTLLFYPVWVSIQSFINPFNVPKEYRCLCFCKHLSMIVDRCWFSCLLLLFFFPIVVIFGLIVGVLNMAVFTVPAIIAKTFKLVRMILFWRCFCCLNRHR